MADPPGSKFATLQELQKRQQAILAGMQGSAMYPDVGQGVPTGDFNNAQEPPRDHDGIVETSDALPSNVGDFSQARQSPDMRGVTTNQYKYKPEFKDAPGAGRGTYEGPMSKDLKHIPGVVEPGPDGMDRVNGPRLSMANASVTGEHAREIESLKKRLAALEGGTSGSADDTLKNAQSGRY